MYIAERKALYDTIVAEKPRHCFEIGTYTGGGSTFFISSAFAKLGQGKLYTMENGTHYYNKAKNFYSSKLPDQNKHIEFIFGEKPNDFDKYIPADKKIDCVFFDGAEEGQQTLDQYNYFVPYFKKGSIIMFHDWNTEKTVLVKPFIIENQKWEQVVLLNQPVSLGFSIFKYKG